jgi:hypothetical protein
MSDPNKGQDDNQPEDMTTGVTACGPGGLRTQIDDPGISDASRSAPAIATAREPGDATVTPWPDDGEPSPVKEDDGAPAGEEAALAARERVAAERAEYARLVAEAAQAKTRQQDLHANHPDRGNAEACLAHKAQVDAATEAIYEADDAADAYLREHPELVPVYDTALRWHALGICSVPVRNDGSKAPFSFWKEYQEHLPTDKELWDWHHRGDSGLGIVTGRTDRDDGLDLEMFEHEGRAISEGINEEFLRHIAEAGLTEVWNRIMAGYWEISPSEGLHAYWLAPDICGNVKLAQRLATPEELAENPKDKYRTLIESRGRGGFSVAAPTPGSFHPSRRGWIGVGSPENLAIITAEEREGIFACARKCHKVPKGAIHERSERAKHETLARPARSQAEASPGSAAPQDDAEAGTRPGDLFNQYGPDWSELLEPHGWRQAGAGADGEIRWTRPGKAGGPSATTGNPQHEGDKFHCFTSSTEFEPDESYSRFAVYAILNHDGDFAAAAAQLRKDGYVSASEAAKTGDLKRPDVYPAILAFEQAYDLRPAADGFYARPCDPDTPAVVTEIGDDLEYAVMRWWRAQAEAWNDEVHRGAIEATDDWKAELEAQDPLVQLERLRKIVYDDQERKDEGESKTGTDPVPRVDTFSRIMKHLRASATQHEPVKLHLRVADGPGYVAVDLGDGSGSVVLITADGWEIVDPREIEGEPWFRHGGAMMPQVRPVQPDDVVATLEAARNVLGLDPAQWRLALAGLIGAYFPSIARPGWWLTGPSGAGKTTRGEMLTGWVDPVDHLGGRINLKRDERNARTKAMNTFVFTLDNASAISQDESDFWCTMHTGTSDQVRKLHSDNTMLNYSYRRIGLGTSLFMPTGFAPDALRRMLHIQLESSDDHPDVVAIKETYDQIKPTVMGAVFTLIAEVLKHLPKALEEPLPGIPEMSDFARRLKAADLAFPGLVADQEHPEAGGLYEAYREAAIDILIAAGLENPVVVAVIRALRTAGADLDEPPAKLYGRLCMAAGLGVNDKRWPPNAIQLGHKLTELTPTLERLGVIVKRDRSKKSRHYIITRDSSFAAQVGAVSGDDGDDAGDDET